MEHTMQVFTDKEKVGLARRVTEHGIISTIHYFTKIEGQKARANCTITASTLHGWKVKYFQKLAKNDHKMKTQKL